MDNVADILPPLLSEDDLYRIVEESRCFVEKCVRHLVRGKPFVHLEFFLTRNVTTGPVPETRRASLSVHKIKGKESKSRGTRFPYIPESNLKVTLRQLGVTFG
jgi:hypothetical protein